MSNQDKGTVPDKDKLRVHVLGHNYGVQAMFVTKPQFKLSSLLDAHIVCFTGGEDVSPSFYGDVSHPTTKTNAKRDDFEKRVFEKLRSRQIRGLQDVTFVGICRGGQFLNVMNGGQLWQHCDQHVGSHELIYTRQKGAEIKIMVTSTHHQMMIPTKDGSQLWGKAFLSTFRDMGNDNHKVKSSPALPDPEIVFYPKTKSLCFQPHPEYFMGPVNEPCRALFFTCLMRARNYDIDNAQRFAAGDYGDPPHDRRVIL